MPGMFFKAKPTAVRDISSKASTAPPLSYLARSSSAMAASAVCSPAIATARDTATGNSFRLAAVTTPNVPSAPINNCFRS